MIILFLILVLLCSAVLGFVILVQNPKGGGLAGNVGGLSNQFMGVKQTTDVLEKGTWIFSTIVALLCIFSAVFIPTAATKNNGLLDQINTKTTTMPVQQQPAQNAQPVLPPPTNNQPATPQK
jgi:preprotein translocase subunit SecG